MNHISQMPVLYIRNSLVSDAQKTTGNRNTSEEEMKNWLPDMKLIDQLSVHPSSDTKLLSWPEWPLDFYSELEKERKKERERNLDAAISKTIPSSRLSVLASFWWMEANHKLRESPDRFSVICIKHTVYLAILLRRINDSTWSGLPGLVLKEQGGWRAGRHRKLTEKDAIS